MEQFLKNIVINVLCKIVMRRADHPSKESYRLSLIKKLRKLSPMLQNGSNEEEKNDRKIEYMKTDFSRMFKL
jgi:hypothetical protein